MSFLRSTRWIPVLLCILLTLGLAGEADAQRQRGKKGKTPATTGARATIVLSSGRAIERVTIKEAKFKLIRYKERGRRPAEISGEQVAEIRYDGGPPAYASGQSQFTAGLYDKAVASFGKARQQAEDSSWVWVYATHWLGQSHLLGGDYAAAAKAFKEVLAKDPENFIAPASTYGLGEALVGLSDYAKAKASFTKLDEAYGPYWGTRSKLGIGRAALKKGEPTSARKAFQIAGDRAKRNRFTDLERAAKVGAGESFVKDKRWKDAIKLFERIMQEPGVAPEVAAGAWVGKGDCLLAQAKAKGSDKNLLKEALIAYQTCSMRFAGIPDSYPKALYQAAALYEELGLPAQAKLIQKELKSRCPSSPWTKKLKK